MIIINSICTKPHTMEAWLQEFSNTVIERAICQHNELQYISPCTDVNQRPTNLPDIPGSNLHHQLSSHELFNDHFLPYSSTESLYRYSTRGRFRGMFCQRAEIMQSLQRCRKSSWPALRNACQYTQNPSLFSNRSFISASIMH